MPELGKQSQDGQFVFADLDELNSIIAELEGLEADIATDEIELRYAITDAAAPPAGDDMSRLQVGAYRESLKQARLHSMSMHAYVLDQLDKLRAARHAYTEADATAEDGLHHAEGAGQ